MEEKENMLKVTLSEDELNSISGGLAVTKEVVINGLATRLTLTNNSVASVCDGKNMPGGNPIFGPNNTPGSIL